MRIQRKCFEALCPFTPKSGPMSNFHCSLTRNITSHIIKNLAFHSLLRWRMTILAILTTSLRHFSKGWEIVLFELGSERVKFPEGARAFLFSFPSSRFLFSFQQGIESSLNANAWQCALCLLFSLFLRWKGPAGLHGRPSCSLGVSSPCLHGKSCPVNPGHPLPWGKFTGKCERVSV